MTLRASDEAAARVAAFAMAGVTTPSATPLAGSHARRIKDIARLKECAELERNA